MVLIHTCQFNIRKKKKLITEAKNLYTATSSETKISIISMEQAVSYFFVIK